MPFDRVGGVHIVLGGDGCAKRRRRCALSGDEEVLQSFAVERREGVSEPIMSLSPA